MMEKKPRPLSLVKLKAGCHTPEEAASLPFNDDFPLIFLGEIPNMPDHGVVAGFRTGRIYSGYHIEQFTELNEEEI